MRALIIEGPIELASASTWIQFAGWKPLANYLNENKLLFTEGKVKVLVDFETDPSLQVQVDYYQRGGAWIPSVHIHNALMGMVKQGQMAQTILKAITRA